MSQEREAAPRLLFVCSGNICRSPMAAAIAADAATRAGQILHAVSCGTAALVGEPVEPEAQEALAELGLSLAAHRARQATRDMVLECALAVGVTRIHCAALKRLGEDCAERVVSFDELTGLGDIPDPYGSGLGSYRTVRDTLVAGMPLVLAALKARLAHRAKHAHVP